jgi:hypothetical protein
VKLAMMFVMETETEQEEAALLESISPIAKGVFPLAQHPFLLPDGLPPLGSLPQVARPESGGNSALDEFTESPMIEASSESEIIDRETVDAEIIQSPRCIIIDAYMPHVSEVHSYSVSELAPLEKACHILEDKPQSSMYLDVVA